MTEIYDKWAGNPKGIPEDQTRCVEKVTDFTGFHFFQCSRKRGYGPDGKYCKQHAKRAKRLEEIRRMFNIPKNEGKL